MTPSKAAVFVFAILAMLPARGPDMAWAQALDWTALDGTIWRGTGQLRQRPTDALERGVCRFSVSATADGRSLALRGRCANGEQSVATTTELRRTGTNTIAAVSTSRLYPAPVTLAGVEDDRVIELRSTAPVAIDGASYTLVSRMQIDPGNTQFVLLQSLLGSGTSHDVLQMRFARE